MGFAPFAFSQWALGSIYPCSATKTVFGAARSPYPTRFAGQSVERCSTSSSSVVWRLEVPHYEGHRLGLAECRVFSEIREVPPYNCERSVTPYGHGLAALWRVPFDH